MKLAIVAFAIAVTGLSVSAMAQVTPANTQIVTGSCTDESHIAEGPIGADLTKLRSRFFCDTMLVSFLAQPGHMLVQFVLKKSETAQILGFGGYEKDNTHVEIDRAYFQPKTPIAVDVGECVFDFNGQHIGNVFCGAKIDANGYRTVASVIFHPDPGQ